MFGISFTSMNGGLRSLCEGVTVSYALRIEDQLLPN